MPGPRAAVGAVQRASHSRADRPVNFADAPAGRHGARRRPGQGRCPAAHARRPDGDPPHVMEPAAAGRAAARPLRADRIHRDEPVAHRAGPDDPRRCSPAPIPTRRRPSSSSRSATTLQIPDEIAWMFDFERALEVGMAFRIDLSPEQAQAGFDRLIVLGVRLGDSPRRPRSLERLLEHHLNSRAGLELLPQGTPTNNTEKAGTGYSCRDDPDASFDAVLQQAPEYALEPDPRCEATGSGWPSCSGSARPGSGSDARAATTSARRAPCRSRCGRRRWATRCRRCWRRCSATATSSTRGGSSPVTSAGAARRRRSGSAPSPTGSSRPPRSPGSTGWRGRPASRGPADAGSCCAWTRLRRVAPTRRHRQARRRSASDAAGRSRAAPDLGSSTTRYGGQPDAQFYELCLLDLSSRQLSSPSSRRQPIDLLRRLATPASRSRTPDHVFRASRAAVRPPRRRPAALGDATRSAPTRTRQRDRVAGGCGAAGRRSRRSRGSTTASRRGRFSTCCCATR